MHRYLRRQNSDSDIQNDEEACGTVLYHANAVFAYNIGLFVYNIEFLIQYRIFVTRNIQ